MSGSLPAGLATWIGAMIVLPAPIAARILLLAPLVVIPRLLPLLPARRWIGSLGEWPSLLAAVPLLVAFALPVGPLAAVFVLPWLAVALIGTASAVAHGVSNLPTILHPRRMAELGVDVALGFWGVAAAFTVIDRLGADIGFAPIIVLLTATHFHFAGFALLAIASLLATRRRWLSASVLGLVAGIPVTALGFILASDLVGAVGAILVGLSGIGVAIALVSDRPAGRFGWLSRLAGVALLVGMPMGIAWSLAILTGRSFIDLDSMIRTHGVLNATALLLAVASRGIDDT